MASKIVEQLLADILNQMIPMAEAVKEKSPAQAAAEQIEARRKEADTRRKDSVGDLQANLGGIPGAQPVANVGRAVGDAGSMIGKAAETAGKDGLASVAGIASAGAALGAVGLAAGALAGAFEGIVSQSTKFVDAFAPSTVEVFNSALRDLHATIGQALQPVIESATAVLRDFGSTLMPIMQALRPVVQQLTEAFASAASAVIDTFGRVATMLLPLASALADLQSVVWSLVEPVLSVVNLFNTALIPVFAALSAVVKTVSTVLYVASTPLKMLGDACEAAAVVVTAVFDTIGAVLGAAFGDGFKEFKTAADQMRDAFREIAKAGVKLVATFAQMMGWTDFLKNLQSGLGGKKASNVGVAAAQNANIGSYSSFGNSVSTAAFTASGTLGEKKDDKEWLADIAKSVEEIAKGKGENWVEIIANGVAAGAGKLAGKAAGGVLEKAAGAASSVLFPGLGDILSSGRAFAKGSSEGASDVLAGGLGN